MNGTWTVGDMHPQQSRTGQPQIQNASGVKFLSIHGHCHAPTCITFELFNAGESSFARQRDTHREREGHPPHAEVVPISDCSYRLLLNADTGGKICSQQPMYGSGNASEDFQEDGYINIAPCIFGDAEDFLPAPPGGDKGLPMSTRLFSKKVCRADYAHHGEMSLWQTYGVLVA